MSLKQIFTKCGGKMMTVTITTKFLKYLSSSNLNLGKFDLKCKSILGEMSLFYSVSFNCILFFLAIFSFFKIFEIIDIS